MKLFDPTLIYLIFDVESIGDGPRVPRAHLEVVLTPTLRFNDPPPVRRVASVASSSWSGSKLINISHIC